MASYAASALLSPDGTSRGQAISAAIVKVIRCGRFVGQQAIQLHGAIGLTDECSIGHYYKRLEGISVLLGGADHHLSRFAAGMTKE